MLTASDGDTKSSPTSKQSEIVCNEVANNVVCIDNQEDWRTIVELRKSLKISQKQEQTKASLKQIKKEKKALHNLMEKYQCAS